MQNRFFGKRAAALTLAAALVALPHAAQAQSAAASPALPSAPAPRAAATGKRVIWTIVGAGVGFGLGAWVGFAKFDDATYAERKITTAAVIGAAAGAVLGATLSADRRPSFVPRRPAPFDAAAAARALPLGRLSVAPLRQR